MHRVGVEMVGDDKVSVVVAEVLDIVFLSSVCVPTVFRGCGREGSRLQIIVLVEVRVRATPGSGGSRCIEVGCCEH